MEWTPAGVISGTVTPFTDTGTVDWDSLHRHLHRLASSGVTAILVNAAMAEGGHLTAQERDEVLSFAVREVGDRIPVVATVYGANTTDAAEQARRAAQLGARGLLVYPHPAFGGEPLDPGGRDRAQDRDGLPALPARRQPHRAGEHRPGR